MNTLAAIATGLLLWACYPPLNLGGLVGVALLPLLAALWRDPSPVACGPASPASRSSGRRSAIRRVGTGLRRWTAGAGWRGFLHGTVAGAVFFLLTLKWLHHVTSMCILLALYLALYVGAWGAWVATVGRPRRWDSASELVRACLLTSAAWTGLEWLRGIALTGFGWNGLGVALWQNLRLAQAADIVGVTGLSWFIVFASSSLAAAALAVARHQPRARSRMIAGAVIPALGAVAALWLYGAPRSLPGDASASDREPLEVALVQPNIPQELKNIPEEFGSIAYTLAQLTKEAFAREPKPRLVVWPESALPAPFFDPGVQEFLGDFKQLGDFAHVLGADEQRFDTFYNSVALFRGDPAGAALHAKVHLVPFGEYLPARGLFGRFEFIRAQLPGDFDAGDSTEPLVIPGSDTQLIPLVCFEDTLGRVARQFARPAPQVIVNVTNDAWFRDSEGADQHLANAIFRAIELRRPMIRAANTGVTAVIDPLGQVTRQLARLDEGVLKASIAVPRPGTMTFFARHGDVFSQAMAAVTLVGLLAAVRRRPTAKRLVKRAAPDLPGGGS